MSDIQETFAEIIAEWRECLDATDPAVWNDRRIAGLVENEVRHQREYMNRLEAAHRRELAAGGDAAKLREAIDYLCERVADMDATFDPSEVECLRAALSAPPRNCDKYATADEALKAQEQMFNDSNFANGECKLGCPECDNPRVGCKIAWLFAPATEKEGGAE